MRTNLLLLTVVLLPVYSFSQEPQACNTSNVEFIVGGGSNSEVNSRCVVTVSVTQPIPAESSADLIPAMPARLTKSKPIVKALSPKVNLRDSETIKERNSILLNELNKATLLKEDLLSKKKNGQPVNDLQLNRLDADIAAIRNEISRQ